jgi:acyl dehydratase
MHEATFEEIQGQVGRVFHSGWLLIDQPMIDLFADATGDHQFIHVDPEAAARTPLGGTIAHGFLLLSILSRLHMEMDIPHIAGRRMSLNYGFERVRFVSPVRSGSRVRAVTRLAAFEQKRPGQYQQQLDVTLEIEGSDKPALTAVWLGQALT